MIDRKKIFDALKQEELFPAFKQSQVDGIGCIIDRWDVHGFSDLRWLAYMLATVYHETDRAMQPIEEYGKGKGLEYGVPDATTGKTYYGRGFVQLTWFANYEKFGKLLNIPLTTEPELACDLKYATEILFTGMVNGYFTGKRLDNYFNSIEEDWRNARRIINGLDKADVIAVYAQRFNRALNGSKI